MSDSDFLWGSDDASSDVVDEVWDPGDDWDDPGGSTASDLSTDSSQEYIDRVTMLHSPELSTLTRSLILSYVPKISGSQWCAMYDFPLNETFAVIISQSKWSTIVEGTFIGAIADIIYQCRKYYKYIDRIIHAIMSATTDLVMSAKLSKKTNEKVLRQKLQPIFDDWTTKWANIQTGEDIEPPLFADQCLELEIEFCQQFRKITQILSPGYLTPVHHILEDEYSLEWKTLVLSKATPSEEKSVRVVQLGSDTVQQVITKVPDSINTTDSFKPTDCVEKACAEDKKKRIRSKKYC